MRPRRQHDDANGDRIQAVTGALHDVSNALTVLLGWVAEARATTRDPTSLDRALAMIEQRARVARDLARRAMQVDARDDAGAPDDAPLDAIVRDVVEALSVEAHRARVRIATSGAHAAATARVHGADDLAQVLTNLLMNALAWSPRDAEVRVSTRVESPTIELEVQDAGPGIAPERVGAVFEGESTRPGGAGIGLRHARAVARMAGGDLTLLAPVPGEGARFRVTWPRAGASAAAAGPMSAPRVQVLAGTRVLLLEDDPDVVTLLETALGARGADVTVARSAAELEGAARATHDVALLDLSPIATDVEGAVGLLRRSSPAARLVFISGTAIGLPGALAKADVRWVRKPFEVSEIVDALTGAKSE